MCSHRLHQSGDERCNSLMILETRRSGLQSSLTGRSRQVLRDGCLFHIVSILVAFHSVFGAILFILYTVDVYGITASYDLDCHGQYAHNTEVCMGHVPL